MISPTLPGFKDNVQDAQQTFRRLLDALANPGRVEAIANAPMPPGDLTPACAAACLTLLDLETRVWIQPGLDGAVRSWLAFHTGCRFTSDAQQAHFAVIGNVADMPQLQAFNWGSAECPEASTTLLMQTPSLVQGASVVLQGPGILGERAIAPQVPLHFWEQWLANHRAYPLGVDVFLFSQHEVMGLPRTAELVGN